MHSEGRENLPPISGLNGLGSATSLCGCGFRLSDIRDSILTKSSVRLEYILKSTYNFTMGTLKLQLVETYSSDLDQIISLMSNYYKVLNEEIFKFTKYTSNIERLKSAIVSAIEDWIKYFSIVDEETNKVRGLAVVDIQNKKGTVKGWIYFLYIVDGTTGEYREVLKELISYLKEQGAEVIEGECSYHPSDKHYQEAVQSLQGVFTNVRWVVR